jgi:CBS-domain-containing membrane protein
MVLSARFTAQAALSFPFTTSTVLVMAAPESRPARPWNVVVGHAVSAVSGLVAVALFGQGDLAASLGVGLAIAAMILADALHPPAGINALMPAYLALDWHFVVMPVAIGAVALVVFAKVFHRLTGTGEATEGITSSSPPAEPPAPPP